MYKGKILSAAFTILMILQSGSASSQWFWQNQTPLIVNRYEIEFVNSTTAYSIGTDLMKTTDFGNTWFVLNLPVGVNYFSGLQFLNPDVGYVTVTDGRILKTTNGGLTWTILSTGTNYRFYCVHFLNEQTGYVGGNRMDAPMNGIIMKTENGGLSWEPQGPLTNYITLSINFPDVNTGYATAANSWILKTTNAGVNWTRLDLDDFDVFEEIHFTSVNTGFAVGFFPNGGHNMLLKTSDGGTTWTDHIPDYTIPVRKIKFSDAMNGRAMSNNGIMLQTTDNGESWSTSNLNTSISTNSFSFSNTDSGMVVGNGGLQLKTTNKGVNWTEPEVITQSDLRKIIFTSINTGYAAGASGTILKTPNAGLQWQRMETAFTSNLSVLHFIDDNTGFTGQSSGLYKTTNGGANWQFRSIEPGGQIIEMNFTDNTNGTLINEAGDVFKSTNAGDTWTRVTGIPLWLNVNRICFADDSTIYAAVDEYIENKIYKSVNSGLSWTLISDMKADAGMEIMEFGPMKFDGRDTGYLAVLTDNFQNHVLKTTNGGLNWSGVQISVFNDFKDIFITPNKYVYLTGAGGKIFKSTDMGETWRAQLSGTQNVLNSMFFSDNNIGYIAGAYGTIIKTINGGELTVGINNASVLPNGYTLYQNYPNPFNPTAKIQFEIASAGNVNIKVYDITGRFVSSLANNYYQPGVHTVNFDGSGLSSGVYFYRIESGNFVQTKRMVLMK